ncbi:MAG: 16S rRNA (cytidine(1402)-2'-O)-methyltransferase [Desulfurivibrio sp.]
MTTGTSGKKGAGTLYVVATPIGNLEDITLRALRILKEVDLIAAEDTRHTRKLLNHFQINTPCRSYYREREAQRTEELLTRLAAGASVALVSDAGTPGIADPGALLVNRAREAGFTVVPIPGPSALTTLLSVAGQTEAAHLFLGFLPARAAQRRRLLQSLRSEARPLIFYESPRRLLKSMADCLAVLGERRALVGRELTKIHEEFQAGDLAALLAELGRRPSLKGEFVVLLAGHDQTESRPACGEDGQRDNIEELAAWYRDQAGLSLKDAARRIAVDLDRPRSEVYRRLLDCWE